MNIYRVSRKWRAYLENELKKKLQPIDMQFVAVRLGEQQSLRHIIVYKQYEFDIRLIEIK